MNYLNLLTEDLLEYIFDILTNYYENEINFFTNKIKTIKYILEPLTSFYNKNNENIISYDNIYCTINKKLFERIYQNNIILINKYDPFFSGQHGVGNNYISNKLNFPTYFDILVEANKSVVYTGDYHHIYLEGLNPISSDKLFDYVGIIPQNNYKYYEFILTS